MEKNIVALTKKLITIQSTPDNKKALDECLEFCLSQLKGFTIERFEQNGFKSALIYNTPTRPKKFKVILNGHLDIIPGKKHQYTPQSKGDRLYGVGSMDMKSSIASFITIFQVVAKKVNYPLAVQLVTDEEIGGFHGTKYQIDKGVRSDLVIVGETTNFEIENQAKGIIWAKVKAKGKAAHGAYPWKGENAIWKLHTFLTDLNTIFPAPKRKQWTTTVNLSRIETNNETFNKIPDYCEAWLDIRYIPDDVDKVIPAIKKVLPKGCTLEILVKEPAQFVEKDNHSIKALQKAGRKVMRKSISLNQGQGSSDARHFARVGNDAIEFGPLGGGMGTDEEWVSISSLSQYAEILKQFLLNT